MKYFGAQTLWFRALKIFTTVPTGTNSATLEFTSASEYKGTVKSMDALFVFASQSLLQVTSAFFEQLTRLKVARMLIIIFFMGDSSYWW
jgi:hypothetical protein